MAITEVRGELLPHIESRDIMDVISVGFHKGEFPDKRPCNLCKANPTQGSCIHFKEADKEEVCCMFKLSQGLFFEVLDDYNIQGSGSARANVSIIG